MESKFKFLEDLWVYYLPGLNMDLCEYEKYSKIICKIRENDFNFTEEDNKQILELISIIMRSCDYDECVRLIEFKSKLQSM